MEQIVEDLRATRKAIADLKEREAKLSTALLEIHKNEILKNLEGKDYGCGTVNLETPAGKIKVVISKNVKWDQDGLAKIWNSIESAGEDPTEYINLKYDVSENSYKSWPSHIKKSFEPIRIVEQSNPKITLED